MSTTYYWFSPFTKWIEINGLIYSPIDVTWITFLSPSFPEQFAEITTNGNDFDECMCKSWRSLSSSRFTSIREICGERVIHISLLDSVQLQPWTNDEYYTSSSLQAWLYIFHVGIYQWRERGKCETARPSAVIRFFSLPWTSLFVSRTFGVGVYHNTSNRYKNSPNNRHTNSIILFKYIHSYFILFHFKINSHCWKVCPIWGLSSSIRSRCSNQYRSSSLC